MIAKLKQFARLSLLLICAGCALTAAVVDRIAIAVGHQAITGLQIDEELRVTAFLNEKPIDRAVAQRRAAGDRLVQQLLVKREMEQSHYPMPTQDEVMTYLQRVRGSLGTLGEYDLTEATLREHLTLQLMALQFIEYRFRPDAGVSQEQAERRVDEALNTWLEETRKQVHIVYMDKTLQ